MFVYIDFISITYFILVLMNISWLLIRFIDLINCSLFIKTSVLIVTIDLTLFLQLIVYFLFWIEYISNIFRTVSLGFRLFTNILEIIILFEIFRIFIISKIIFTELSRFLNHLLAFSCHLADLGTVSVILQNIWIYRINETLCSWNINFYRFV